MTESSQIHIHRMIIHKVDHLSYDAPQVSDVESPITDEVASFVRQQISSNREHKFARTATFHLSNGAQTSLQPVCDCLLGNTDQLVPQSQEIAKRLFDTMDRRVSPGDLVLCIFTETAPDGPLWLALLKMDPQDGFIGEREEINGHACFVLRRVRNVLPRGELQKCAFIVPSTLRGPRGYDLKVLDQQAIPYGARRLVASFFVTDFLRCKVGLNRADRTWTFASASHEWVGKKKNWPDEKVDDFKKRVTETLQDQVVDATSFATAVITQPDEQDEYLQYLRQRGLEDLAFEPDPQERQRLTQYVQFEGDHGLRVRVEADAIGEGKVLWYAKESGTDNWIVTIKTTRWERGPK